MWQLVKQTKQKSDHPSRFANNLSGYPAHYYTLQIFLMRIPSQHPAAAWHIINSSTAWHFERFGEMLH